MRRGDFIERVPPGAEPRWPQGRIEGELEAIQQLCRDLGMKSTPVEEVISALDGMEAEGRWEELHRKPDA